MPFMLIVQLLFSGGFFSIPQSAMPLTNLTATKWGLTALCSQGDYNSLPMVSVWNNALKMKNLDVEGEKPLLEAFTYIEQNNMRDELLMKSGELNQKEEYNFDPEVLLTCWEWLILWAIVYSVITIILLENIDKDKR